MMTRKILVLLAPILSLLTCAVGIAQSSPPVPTTQATAAQFHPAGDYAVVNGIRLWYESEGSGPPLILVPAGPGVPHGYFHPYMSLLSKKYRVIYYDAFGTGKSDRAHGQQKYSFALDVENLEGLRSALGLPKVSILGHSYGGLVALAYALRYPGAVNKLILADSSWGGEMSEAHRENGLHELQNQYPETYDRLKKLHEKGFHSCSKEYREADNSPPGFLLFYDNSNFQKLIRTGEPPESQVLCAIDGDDGDFVAGPEMAKLDFHEQLKDLKMPTLVIAGRFDRGMLPRYALQFKTYAQQVHFAMFEKSGHFPFIEETERFIRVVDDFLQEQPGS